MDFGTNLVLRSVLLGLRRSGQLGGHALTVVCDELRLAAGEARNALYDREAEQIEQLIFQLRDGPETLRLQPARDL